MSVRKIFLLILILFLGTFTILSNTSKVFAQTNMIIKNVVPDLSGNIILIHTNTYQSPLKFKVSQLVKPSRLIVDLSDTILVDTKKSVNIPNASIKNIKLAQFSKKPLVTRLVLTGNDTEDFKNITLNKSSNSIIIKLNKITAEKIVTNRVYTEKVVEKTTVKKNAVAIIEPALTEIKKLPTPVIKEVKNTPPVLKINPPTPRSKLKNDNYNITYTNAHIVNNNLTLSGIGTAGTKEPFMLNNPSRVVFDLPNSNLDYDNIIKNVKLTNGDIARIGQFEENTVRVVIETNNPDNYTTILSADLQSVIFTQKNEITYSELPNCKTPAQINDIKVLNTDNLSTKIILISNQPIIHNIKKDQNLNLDLYNVLSPNRNLLSGLNNTGQFNGIKIQPIEKFPSGSRWILPIKKQTQVESRLSMDGKILEVTLKDPAVIIPVRNANGYKKVVIDPGHGGSEPGAIRDGIYEKDITLNVSKLVKKYLTAAGVGVIMTREDDVTVSLKDRTNITNQENPDAFVSIHVNSSISSQATGTETHYYKDQGKPLATQIQAKLANKIKSPNRGILKSMFYVIHHTEVPAVLVEIGFISNNAERNLLLNEERQDNIAKAIVDGILEYLSFKNSSRVTELDLTPVRNVANGQI